ncbi:MAG: hypothetical protein R2706_15665 [Acidimicrobiales bacterium]
MPKTLKAALAAAGGREIDAAPSGKGRRNLLETKLTEAPIRLDAASPPAHCRHAGRRRWPSPAAHRVARLDLR